MQVGSILGCLNWNQRNIWACSCTHTASSVVCSATSVFYIHFCHIKYCVLLEFMSIGINKNALFFNVFIPPFCWLIFPPFDVRGPKRVQKHISVNNHLRSLVRCCTLLRGRTLNLELQQRSWLISKPTASLSFFQRSDKQVYSEGADKLRGHLGCHQLEKRQIGGKGGMLGNEFQTPVSSLKSLSLDVGCLAFAVNLQQTFTSPVLRWNHTTCAGSKLTSSYLQRQDDRPNMYNNEH